MVMETLLTKKTISVTEMREPKKVLERAGSQPVAVLNRSNVVGYFVPVSAVEKLEISTATDRQVDDLLDSLSDDARAVNEYLKDK
jgi:antitoxin StbD